MLLVFWVCLGVSSSLWALVLLLCAWQTSTVFSGGRYPGRKGQRWTVRRRDRKNLAPYRDFQQEEGGRPATCGWKCLLQQSNLHRTYGSLTGDKQVSQLRARLASGAEWLIDIIIQQVQELICQNKILFKSCNSENCMHCCPLQRG